MSDKPTSDFLWQNAEIELGRAVYLAWSAESSTEAQDHEAYNREATREELLRWTAAARPKLIAAIDKLIEGAVKQYGTAKAGAR